MGSKCVPQNGWQCWHVLLLYAPVRPVCGRMYWREVQKKGSPWAHTNQMDKGNALWACMQLLKVPTGPVFTRIPWSELPKKKLQGHTDTGGQENCVVDICVADANWYGAGSMEGAYEALEAGPCETPLIASSDECCKQWLLECHIFGIIPTVMNSGSG